MKMVHAFRTFFQALVLLSLLAIVGTAGALEAGSINLLQFILQTCLLFGCATFFARASRKRIIVRLRRKRRPAVKQPDASERPPFPLHAA